MAANINLHQPRVDYAHAERDDENNQGEGTTPEGPTSAQAETTINAPTEQHGQSGNGNSSDAGTLDSANALPLPVESEPAIRFPSPFRYGIGEVSVGRPNYPRANADRTPRAADAADMRDTALAPRSRAENPPPHATPGATPGATSAKPIPLPKPGGTIAPGTSPSAPASAALPSATTNAPGIGGEAVRQALATDQRNSQNVVATSAASAAELEAVDAMLADPINKQLIDLAKQKMEPAPTNNAVADAQIKLYGEARFQDMMYLHRALPMVQDAYAQAVKEAYLANSQPALTANLTNNQGIVTPPSTFDINAFNKEYESRSDLMAQAFAAKFGGVPVTQEMVISGTFTGGDGGGDASGAYVPVFNVGGLFSVSMTAVFPTGYADGQEGSPPTYFASRTPNTMQQYVLGHDIGDHRAMFDDTAVWFDPSMGFVTDPRNMKDDEDSHFDHIMGVVGPIMLTGILAAAGAEFLIGPQGSAVLGFSGNSWQAGAIRGAVQGAVGTVANSVVTGRPLTLADLGRSIFTGGVMGGLVNYARLDTYGITTQNGVQVINWGERLTAILGRSAMQGILQQVTGGRFQDGLRNGLISSVSNELSRGINTEINRWAAENNVDPFIASQLRMVGQGFASALVRSAANGGQGGVEAFLTDLINGEIGAAGEASRAEINTLTTQYNEALRTNDVSTQANVLNNLIDRWMSNHREDTPEQALVHVTQGLGWTVDQSRFARDGNGQLVSATAATPTVDRPTAVTRIAMAYRAGDGRLSDDEATRLANDYINRFGIPATFAPVMVPYMDIVAPRLTGIEREFADAERVLREVTASKDPVAIRNALTAYNNLQAREAMVYHQPFTYGEFDMGGNTVADRGRPLSYAEEMRNVGMAFSSIALGTLELSYASVHNYVVRLVGGLVSIPGLVLNSAEAAASIQESFKETYGYELKTDQAHAFIAAIAPAAEVIHEIYQHGRNAAVGVFGEGAVTLAETALQAGMEAIGVVNGGRGLTSAIESLPVGSTVRNRILSRSDDWVFVPDGASGSTLNGGIRIGGKYIETVTDSMRAAYKGVDYLDPLTNTIRKAPANEVMAVDHIFPSREIIGLKGFDTLTRAQQTAILQDTLGLGNLQPLPSSLNASKGPSLNWTTYKGQNLHRDYIQHLRGLQDNAQAAIERQIAIYQAANAVKGKT